MAVYCEQDTWRGVLLTSVMQGQHALVATHAASASYTEIITNTQTYVWTCIQVHPHTHPPTHTRAHIVTDTQSRFICHSGVGTHPSTHPHICTFSHRHTISVICHYGVGTHPSTHAQVRTCINTESSCEMACSMAVVCSSRSFLFCN